MDIRNFWAKAQVDGRRGLIGFGPRAAGGGFTQTIYLRDGDAMKAAVDISGEVAGGELRLYVRPDRRDGLTFVPTDNRDGPDGGFVITVPLSKKKE